MPSVLVACEFSGRVRDAFAARGFEAWSCDYLPSETEGNHWQADVLTILNNQNWDLIIAHPPCTYLCGMGIWWNHKRPERWPLTYEAKAFVERLWAADCKHMAIENPIGYLNNNWRKPDQIINPWQFGDEAHKPTCLWLRGLPKLQPTKIVDRGKFYVKANGSRMSAWSHVTSGTRKEERAKIAATTFQGIADAMAQQWSSYLLERT